MLLKKFEAEMCGPNRHSKKDRSLHPSSVTCVIIVTIALSAHLPLKNSYTFHTVGFWDFYITSSIYILYYNNPNEFPKEKELLI